jgi:regulator of sigma E protease
MIVRIYYMLFEGEDGWKLALWFSVVLNVNLAFLIMLPIPVLDGGHIVLAMIEGIRRKPVNMSILEWVQTACATLIIGYMLYITFFDIGDLFGNNDQKSPRRERSSATEATPGP